MRKDGANGSSSRGRTDGSGASVIDDSYGGNIALMRLLAISFSVVCVEVDAVGVS